MYESEFFDAEAHPVEFAGKFIIACNHQDNVTSMYLDMDKDNNEYGITMKSNCDYTMTINEQLVTYSITFYIFITVDYDFNINTLEGFHFLFSNINGSYFMLTGYDYKDGKLTNLYHNDEDDEWKTQKAIYDEQVVKYETLLENKDKLERENNVSANRQYLAACQYINQRVGQIVPMEYIEE